MLVAVSFLSACSLLGNVNTKSCELEANPNGEQLSLYLDELLVEDRVDVNFELGKVKTDILSRAVTGKQECPESLSELDDALPGFTVGDKNYTTVYTKTSDYTYNLAVKVDGTIYYAE